MQLKLSSRFPWALPLLLTLLCLLCQAQQPTVEHAVYPGAGKLSPNAVNEIQKPIAGNAAKDSNLPPLSAGPKEQPKVETKQQPLATTKVDSQKVEPPKPAQLSTNADPKQAPQVAAKVDSKPSPVVTKVEPQKPAQVATNADPKQAPQVAVKVDSKPVSPVVTKVEPPKPPQVPTIVEPLKSGQITLNTDPKQSQASQVPTKVDPKPSAVATKVEPLKPSPVPTKVEPQKPAQGPKNTDPKQAPQIPTKVDPKPSPVPTKVEPQKPAQGTTNADPKQAQQVAVKVDAKPSPVVNMPQVVNNVEASKPIPAVNKVDTKPQVAGSAVVPKPPAQANGKVESKQSPVKAMEIGPRITLDSLPQCPEGFKLYGSHCRQEA